VSIYLKGKLLAGTPATLRNYQGLVSDPAPLEVALVKDFNRIIRSQSIYDAQRFAGVSLRPETQRLLAQNPQEDELLRLNRLLLEDAYPLEISRNKADDPQSRRFSKYMQTPRGVFEMRYFFTTGLQTSSGQDVSNTSVKEMLAEIFRAEDPKAPVADDTVADILKEKGVRIARRTVAKYRAELGILPSTLRKVY
jgi:hypothetical protein